jgi:hypothetical protein
LKVRVFHQDGRKSSVSSDDGKLDLESKLGLSELPKPPGKTKATKSSKSKRKPGLKAR